MKQKSLIFTLSLLIVGCASMSGGVPDTNAGQLVSVVESRYIVPPTVPPTDSIANGGFFISGYGRGGSIGDGADENTVWFHSFHINRPQWTAFRAVHSEAHSETNKKIIIRSARLQLKYTPRRASGNDFIQISGLKGFLMKELEGFEGVPSGEPSPPATERRNISIDLLADDRYTSQDILDILEDPAKRGGAHATPTGGVILMRYKDDAIIHYAKLTLKYALIAD